MGGITMLKNKKGFTLIELLIVVAIIAILAAIAIPQFAQYRIRGYNASANTDLRNCRTSEEALFADWQRYGSSELAVLPGTGGSAGVEILGPGASPNLPILTLTDAVVAPRGIGIALGNNVLIHAANDAAWASYVVESKHVQGDTLYAADGDSTANYRQTNSTWVAAAINGNACCTANTAVAFPTSVTGTNEYGAAPWLAM